MAQIINFNLATRREENFLVFTLRLPMRLITNVEIAHRIVINASSVLLIPIGSLSEVVITLAPFMYF